MSEWIPVIERLPDTVDVVLTWDRDEYLFARYAIYDGGTDGVKKGKWYWRDSEGYEWPITITHWQPLPEPPEKS